MLVVPVLLGAAAPVAIAAAALATPAYRANEPAVAVARPSLVYLETTYSGYLRTAATGVSLHSHPLVYRRWCSGVVVNPAGYALTTSTCVQPPAQTILANALTVLGRTLIAQRRLSSDSLDRYVAGLVAGTEFSGIRAGTQPAVRLSGQFGNATQGGSAAVPAKVVQVRPPEAGNVALVQLRRTELPAIEVTTARLGGGSPIEILAYTAASPDAESGPYDVRTRSHEVGDRDSTGRPRVSGVAAMFSGGGAVVDPQGRLVGLLDTDAGVEGGPSRLIPAADLTRVLSDNGVRNRLGDLDHRYRRALEAYFAGRFTQAVTEFDGLLRQAPGFDAARTYRQRAQERVRLDGDAREDSADWPGYALAAAVGTLVVLGTGLGRRLLGAFARRTRPAHRSNPGRVGS